MEKQVDLYCTCLWRDGHVVETVKSLLKNPEVKSITISVSRKVTDEQFKYISDGLLNANTQAQVPIYLYRCEENEKGSNEKLKYLHKGTGKYIALFDDDLIYPSDYLQYMIGGCERYDSYVSLHGVILHERPIRSYYADRHVYRGLGTVINNYEVDIASSCFALFKREIFPEDMIKEIYERSPMDSMDDIWMSFLAKNVSIKRMVLAHGEGWAMHKQIKKEDDYVFEKYTQKLGMTDKPQTDFINNYWDV